MTFDAHLTKVQFDQTHRAIREITRLGEERHLDFDPPYQRASVWGVERKRNLIGSLQMGLPVGILFLNDRGYDPDRPQFAVVDGKQRLLTVTEFMIGAFTVPATWFEPRHLVDGHGPEVTGADLSTVGERVIGLDWSIAVYQTRFPYSDPRMLEQEEMVFDLVNYGGVPQGQIDPDR